MIQKIRDLMQIESLIKDINNRVDENSSCVGNLKDEFGKINSNLASIYAKQDDFLKKFKDNVESIKEVREELRQEMYDFKLLKSQMQNTIIRKFEEELDKELKINLDKFKEDCGKLEKVEEGMLKSNSSILKLTEEIEKLVEISKNIKKEDFELTKFADKVLESDKEKLELMRRIDTLERLISRMRKNH